MEKVNGMQRMMGRREITRYCVIYMSFMLIFLHNERCHGIPVCLWCPPEDGAASCSLCTGCTNVYSSYLSEIPCTLCTKCTSCKSCTPCETCTPCITCVQTIGTLSPCISTKDVNCQRDKMTNNSTEEQIINNKHIKGVNKEDDNHYHDITSDVNMKITRHHRVRRSPSDHSSNDGVISDESLDTAPSSESDEESLDDLLKDEDLFLHNEGNHVIQSEELGHVDPDIALPERGSGEMFATTDWTDDITTATPTGEPLTGSEWTGYDVTISTLYGTEEYENITDYVTGYITEDVTDNVTVIADYDVTVTVADDEFDRFPFSKHVTSSKPEHIEPGKTVNEYQLTDVNVGNQEVVDSSSSASMSKTSVIITVVVIMTVCVVGVIIIVIYSRKQRQLKKTQRNGDYHPTASEEQSREMEALNRSRDDDVTPRDSTETTPLRVDMEPEVIEDLSAESKT